MDEDNAFTEARNFYSKQNASSLVFFIKLLFYAHWYCGILIPTGDLFIKFVHIFMQAHIVVFWYPPEVSPRTSIIPSGCPPPGGGEGPEACCLTPTTWFNMHSRYSQDSFNILDTISVISISISSGPLSNTNNMIQYAFSIFSRFIQYSQYYLSTISISISSGQLSNINNILQYAFSICIFNIPNFPLGSSQHPQACWQCLTLTTCFNMQCILA